jgi:BirA family biotin operon repressor/biotin-[acetyl-CoA-carboxylase] ligase
MALSCRAVCGVDVDCKWPNDLLVGRGKLGGVLAEAKVQEGRMLHAVIGTGVNLTQRPEDFPSEFREIATSVSIEGGRPDHAALLTDYLARLRRLCEASGAEFRAGVLEAYREVCDTLGRLVRATTTLGVEIVGRAEAIGSSGELIVRTATKREKVGFGEISHLD